MRKENDQEECHERKRRRERVVQEMKGARLTRQEDAQAEELKEVLFNKYQTHMQG